MHGHGIVPLMLGLGCNVPGVLAARTLETPKQRFIAATLVSISIPCAAQSAMIFGVLGIHPARYIVAVYMTLASVFIILGLSLNVAFRGESPELFLDIPPYRMPSPIVILKKTWMRVRWFVSEAVPFLFLGILAVDILNVLGVVNFLARVLTPFMQGWFGLPGESVPALLAGFLRKDLAVGMLAPLSLSSAQLAIAVTIMTLYFPCAATFAVLLKELGLKNMIKASGLMILTALIVGGIMRMFLIG